MRAKGAAFVECPVGGTTGPARQGKLLGLAGGNAADVARARAILDQLCRRVEHVGPVGAGASMKLAINLPLMVAYQALGEAYVLCRHLGADPKWLMELFADTSGAPNVLKTRGPAVAEALAGGPGVATAFDIDSIRKDLRTMIAEAKVLGASLPRHRAHAGRLRRGLQGRLGRSRRLHAALLLAEAHAVVAHENSPAPDPDQFPGAYEPAKSPHLEGEICTMREFLMAVAISGFILGLALATS